MLTEKETSDLRLLADGYLAVHSNIASRIGVRFDRFMVDTTEDPVFYLKLTIFSIDHGDKCVLVSSRRYGITSSVQQVGFFSGREAMYSFLKEFGPHDAPLNHAENEERITELLNQLLIPSK